MTTRHYHVTSDCQQVQVLPFMTDDYTIAMQQYNATIEMICDATGADVVYRHSHATLLSDHCVVRWNVCNKDCLSRLTYDGDALERLRKEELAKMPRDESFLDGGA